MTLRAWALTALAGLLLVDPGSAAPQVQAPLPCVHPEMRPLEFLRGAWNVTGSWLGPSGAMDPVVGRSEFSSELGGCLMAERFKGTMKGEPFESLTLFAYDPAGKRHELVHSDSLHGSLVTFTGSAVPDGFAFEAEIHLRRTITLRQEYRRSGQTVVVERKRRFDGSDAWTTVWKAIYVKRQ
jgi:hypothetical protein